MTTDAVLVRWPEQAALRVDAADRGRPCLLVVAPGVPLPAVGDLEDWIAGTADERDVAARLHALAHRAQRRQATAPRAATRAVPIAPSGEPTDEPATERVARILATRAGSLVPRRDLIDGELGDGDLDRLIERARPALRSQGLTIRRVATSGFIATPAEPRP